MKDYLTKSIILKGVSLGGKSIDAESVNRFFSKKIYKREFSWMMSVHAEGKSIVEEFEKLEDPLFKKSLLEAFEDALDSIDNLAKINSRYLYKIRENLSSEKYHSESEVLF